MFFWSSYTVRYEEALKPHFQLSTATTAVEWQQGISCKLQENIFPSRYRHSDEGRCSVGCGWPKVSVCDILVLPMLFWMQMSLHKSTLVTLPRTY